MTRRALDSSRYATMARVAVAISALSTLVLGTRVLRAGYGADNDTFLMLRTWDVLRTQGTYVPSRYQGSPMAELTIGAASQIGGHWMSGLVSVVLGVISLWCVYDLARRRIPSQTDAAIVVAVVAATPVFTIAATTSSDYVYGLCGFLIGWVMIERGFSPVVVGVMLGVAAAGRISYVPLGLALVLLHPSITTATRRLIAAGSIAVIALVAYLPAMLGAESALSIFTADRPTGQGVIGLVARSVIKSGSIFGSVGSVVAIVLVASAIRFRRANGMNRRDEHWEVALVVIVAGLWVWLPAEPTYLLPGVVVALIWLCRRLSHSTLRPLLLSLLAATTLYGWVDIQLLAVTYDSQYGIDSCIGTEATGVSFAPTLVRGPSLVYPDLVDQNAACNETLRLLVDGQDAIRD